MSDEIVTLPAELVFDARAELAEGPIWDESRARLLFVDIGSHCLHEFDPASALDRVLEMPGPISAVACARRGDWIAAVGGGFIRIDPDTGRTTPILEVESPSRRTRMNDGYVDVLGRFWAGSMSLDGLEGQGTLYCLDGSLAARPMLSPVTTSNGPAWSPDSRRMYYVDTRTRRIDVFDFDLEQGAIANRRVFVDFTGGAGRPDGVIVDRDGGVWVGLWEGAALHRYTPDARLDMVVPLPVARVTKCAFGGADLADLYITTAQAAVGDPHRGAEPLAGGIFRARPGVKGLPAPRFAG